MRNNRAILLVAWICIQSACLTPGETAAGKRIAKVAFTFDCAQWGDSGLDHILEVMSRRKITGTFFVTGKFIENNREGILKIVEGGHEVANHSYEHNRKNSIGECDRVARIYEDVTGRKMSRFFRAPYLYEKNIDWPNYAKHGWEKGYVSLITCDALPEYKLISDSLFLRSFSIYVSRGANERISIDKAALQSGPGHINGAAILMHIDGYRYHLLESMVDIVQRGGYRCTTFSEASAARASGDPFPDSKGRGMILPDLSIVPPGPSDATDLALARKADPRPDPDKVRAARRALLDRSVGASGDSLGELSFTFDCNEFNPTGLRSILATLKNAGVQSTFYITEHYFDEFPGAVKAILEHGHEIAQSGSRPRKPVAAEAANVFARRFKEETGEDMVRLFRPSYPGEAELDWNLFATRGWKRGYVSLNTCDLDEEMRTVSDGSFLAYFKIYTAVAPRHQVSILRVPFTGTGNVDGAVIAMHPDGYRYHLLERMIAHAREKGYTPVAQSKLRTIRL